MTLKIKKDEAWKEASSFKVKINGEWKDVSTLYSKKDGAWVTVYSSGALITFSNYPYPIPVAKGWKYSTDKVNWTTVSANGEINKSGTFTGYIKANSITLSNYYTEYTPEQAGARMDGEPLSVARTSATAFVNASKGYVCGGRGNHIVSTVDVYDSNGTRTTGTSLSNDVRDATSFVNNSKGYVCGGENRNYKCVTSVDVYDVSGNKTTGNSMSTGRVSCTSFVNGGKGYVCGGYNNGYLSSVDVYDSSGNRTTGTSLITACYDTSSFVNNNKGYVCGGGYNSHSEDPSEGITTVNVYDTSGNRTTGASLSIARSSLSAFVNGSKGYVCGGSGFNGTSDTKSTVDVYDSNGNRTTGISLSVDRCYTATFVNNSNGYVCGGYCSTLRSSQSVVDIYDASGNMTVGNSLSEANDRLSAFVNSNRGYVCGKNVVDIYYDQSESYSTKLPITEGSTYTLNGESGVASESTIMEFDSKVSGIIKYKSGEILAWDFTNLICYMTLSKTSGAVYRYRIRGITGFVPPIKSVELRNDDYYAADGRKMTANITDPNTMDAEQLGPGFRTGTILLYSEENCGGEMVASYTFDTSQVVNSDPPN